MATSEVQLGRRIDVTLTAAATSGSLVELGNVVGIAQISGNIGDTIAIAVQGVWRCAKDSSTFAAGDPVSLNAGVASSTGSPTFGVATEDAASGASSVTVLLTPAAS